MSGPAIVVLQADRLAWGPFRAAAGAGEVPSQTAQAWRGEELVATVTITWPRGVEACSVVSHAEGRHSGPQD